MPDLPSLAASYATAVKAFIAVERTGKRPSAKLARDVEKATGEYAITSNGHYAVEKDVAASEGRYPLLRKILLRAVNQATLTRNISLLPHDTYSDRIAIAARLQERYERFRRKAARTKAEEDKALALRAHEQWRRAETAAQRPTVGDRFIVVSSRNVPIGTSGSLIRSWQAEYGLRVLLRQSSGQDFWVSYNQVERDTN